MPQRGLKIHEDAGMDYLRTIHYYVLGICHSYTGDDTRAEEFFKTGIEISRQKNERCFRGSIIDLAGQGIGEKTSSKNPEAIENILNGIEISKTLSQRPDLARGQPFFGGVVCCAGSKGNSHGVPSKIDDHVRRDGNELLAA